ncbi:hypothetical protein E0H62_27085 [Rhizobium leguminosarum bv. viciae]|nr:hypothetical protein E0H62_27085 [Rhizobium leguminosarum bv. viciae]
MGARVAKSAAGAADGTAVRLSQKSVLPCRAKRAYLLSIAEKQEAAATVSKPSIEAEQCTVLGDLRTGAKLELHSVRYEVFDLPALVGHTAQLSHAGEIMAVAVSAAGAAFQRLAKNRIPGRLATQEQLDELNADMERMADRLADALSALTDASWWLNNENLFTSEDAYELIVGGGEALRRK